MIWSEKTKWLQPFIKPLRKVFREVMMMSFFVNMMALLIPVFTLQVYDRVVFHAGIDTLVGLVIGMIMVLSFDYILRQSRSRILQTVALKIDVLVGRKLFQHFMNLPLQRLEAKPTPFWQTIFRDVDVVRNTMSGQTAVLIADLPFIVLFFALIFVIARPLAPVLMVILPCFLFVAWRSAKVMEGATRDEKNTSLSRDELIGEIISGRATIKALSMADALQPVWEEKHAENIKNSIVRGGKADAYTNLGLTLTLSTTVLMTTVGAIAIINQELTMGALVATNMLSGRLLGPLNQLVGSWRAFNGFKQSVERLGELFAIEVERQESTIKMERPKGLIGIERVTFAYGEGQHPVVENIAFALKPGSLTALVGRNGSGKTTLIKLLQGLYVPQSGRILLDKADINQFTRSELARWIGYVPQECTLLAGTIRENLIYARPDATDEDIIQACQKVGVHEFIVDLPDGYATPIGEAGRRLSGGQRQKLTIARALLGDPPVLLLDEPSGSLDRQSEEDLKLTLSQLANDHTIVIVTHSPILLSACHNMVVMEKGHVALAGPTQEVLPRLTQQRQPNGAAPMPTKVPQTKPAPSAAAPKPVQAVIKSVTANNQSPEQPKKPQPAMVKATVKNAETATKQVEPDTILTAQTINPQTTVIPNPEPQLATPPTTPQVKS